MFAVLACMAKLQADETPPSVVLPLPTGNEARQLLDRSPLQVAEQLAVVFGHDLPTVQYIPAFALLGRLQLGDLTDNPRQRAEVERIVAPYLNGERPSLTPKSGGSEFAGHYLFGALYDATPAARSVAKVGASHDKNTPDTSHDERYVKLIVNVADRAFDAEGRPLPAMPAHSEMSDAVFMACPVLALAGRVTKLEKYYDMSVRHHRFMCHLNLRADGLHRHSPLSDTAWGRGNGFPALGLVLAISEFPNDHPGRAELVAALRSHLDALVKHQDEAGCWHQVIDHPESYPEFSCTCMIATAMVRGIRLGVLPREAYEAAIHRAWEAIKLRTGSDGTLIGVCEGTGKQKSLDDYLRRRAIVGRDPRGGAMALVFATEMLAWEQARK
jgi:hypothetical protein